MVCTPGPFFISAAAAAVVVVVVAAVSDISLIMLRTSVDMYV